jgi:uncharacterized membrane protein
VTLQPLFNASPVIQAHAFLAMGAFALGAVQLAAPKGTLPHRTLGWIWAALMMSIAASSLFIHISRVWGIWGPIHLLSLLVLISTPYAVISARRHELVGHRIAMTSLFVFALIVAGAFTFAPGRIMNKVLFGA